MLDIIIIGGGPSGLTAGLYAVRAGADVILLEESLVGGKLTTIAQLENYPGIVSVNGMTIADEMEKQAVLSGLRIVNQGVLALDVYEDDGYVLVRTDTDEYKAKCAIIASGTTPKKIGVSGEEQFIGRGVSFCATCDGPLYKNGHVCVVGGGNTAFADALYLSGFAKRVYLIHRRTEFRATNVLVSRAKTRDNIEFIVPAVVTEIIGSDFVTDVEIMSRDTNERSRLSVDAVFAAVGAIPNTSYITDKIETTSDGFVKTDEHMTTNIPFVFAAGDVRSTPLRQVVTAASDGAVAAEAAIAYIYSAAEK